MSNGLHGDITKSKCREWCWTYFTDEVDWELRVHKSELYSTYQWEISTTNSKRHAQGFTQFKSPISFNSMRKMVPGAHLEKRRGSVQEAITYCHKQRTRENPNGVPFERGIAEMKDRPGKRNELEAFKESAKTGVKRKEMMEDHSEVMAKFPQFAKEYMELYGGNQIEEMKDVLLRPWQRQAKKILDGPVDERSIFWFYDERGGKGKSFFSKWLMQNYETFYCRGGKGNDILYAYSGQRVVIFDYTRETEQYVGYGVMEALKDGVYFSAKYQSAMKTWKQPHVFVFANFELDRTKLSADRINVIKFHEDGSAWWEKPNTPIRELFETDDLIEYAEAREREVIEIE